jgi:hypothetical protein
MAALAFLLVLQERFEEAEALVRQSPAPLISAMVAGDAPAWRAGATRARPASSGPRRPCRACRVTPG